MIFKMYVQHGMKNTFLESFCVVNEAFKISHDSVVFMCLQGANLLK